MTAAPRYFCRSVVGVAATEYCVVERRRRGGQAVDVVVAIQYSRPDGDEVKRSELASLTFELPPPPGSDLRAGAAAHSANDRPAVSTITTRRCLTCGCTRPLRAFKRGYRLTKSCSACIDSGAARMRRGADDEAQP